MCTVSSTLILSQLSLLAMQCIDSTLSPGYRTRKWKCRSAHTGYWLRSYIPLNTKYMISEMFPKSISWLGKEKQNLTQQKHTFINQKKCITTQNKHKKTIARFSWLLWHPAWEWTGPTMVLALHKFATYLLRHLPTYLQPRTHMGQVTDNGIRK